MIIRFIGGIIFLASILLYFCASASRKWINADLEATNWDESRGQIDYSRSDDAVALHRMDDCCQEYQQDSEIFVDINNII